MINVEDEILSLKSRIDDIETALEFILGTIEEASATDSELESRHRAFAEITRMQRAGRSSMLRR